ncbi:MAG: hypothetical protein ACPGJU_07890 [Coraliomargarita sp.]
MSTTRREKFVHLAERRTRNAIKQIRLIGNLSNKGNYEYTEADVNKIVNALSNELRNMKDRFASGGSSGKPEFKL